MMFRLMDEINFFFETWCLRVMFQWRSAAPSCGQKWKKTIQKHFIQRHRREHLTASQTQS